MSFDLKISNGDILLNQAGAVDLVYDNSKLRQDIIKIILTNVGENRYHPQYGSKVGALQIGMIPDPNLAEMDISISIETALKNLIALQRVQGKKQYLTPGEIILDILSVKAERDDYDPRLYNIYIKVLTQKLTEIIETVTVKIA